MGKGKIMEPFEKIYEDSRLLVITNSSQVITNSSQVRFFLVFFYLIIFLLDCMNMETK